jgi:hypothetical protein
MKMFVIKDNENSFRVRKEEEGCSIFGPRNFIEGNNSLFEVLEVIHELGLEKGILELKKRYSSESVQIDNDLLELASNFLEQGIMVNLCSQIVLHIKPKEAEL